VDAAAAARLRAAGVAVAAVRAVRAVFAASPRTAAAFEDAARDAAVRLEGVAGDVSTPSAVVPSAAAAFAAPLAGVFAALFTAPARAALLVVVVFAVFAAFDAFGAAVASGAFAASAAFGAASTSVAFVARADVARVEVAGVEDGRLGAARSTAGSPSADIPVPVPSGASSSCAERETEVTQTTYQDPPPNPYAIFRDVLSN
jgi:hypothetical protein